MLLTQNPFFSADRPDIEIGCTVEELLFFSEAFRSVAYIFPDHRNVLNRISLDLARIEKEKKSAKINIPYNMAKQILVPLFEELCLVYDERGKQHDAKRVQRVMEWTKHGFGCSGSA